MKKIISLIIVSALVVLCFAAGAFSTSATTKTYVSDDFTKQTSDVSADQLNTVFTSIDSSQNARIKYAFNEGHLCATGGGRTASVVYRVATVEGRQFSDLDVTVKGYFSSRKDYNPAWSGTPFGMVSLSKNGSDFVDVERWEGDILDPEEYTTDNDFTKLQAKNYSVDLTEAVGNSYVAYVKISWAAYDVPMYSSVFGISITGDTVQGVTERITSTNFSDSKTAVSDGQLLAKYTDLIDSHRMRIVNAFGKRLFGYTGEDCYLVYKISVPEDEAVESIEFAMKGILTARTDYNPEWVDKVSYAKVSVADASIPYEDLPIDGWIDVKQWDAEQISKNQYPIDTASFSEIEKQEYTADLTDVMPESKEMYIMVSFMVWDYPAYLSIDSVNITSISRTSRIVEEPTQEDIDNKDDPQDPAIDDEDSEDGDSADTDITEPSENETKPSPDTPATPSKPTTQNSGSGNGNTQTGGNTNQAEVFVPSTDYYPAENQVESTENTDVQLEQTDNTNNQAELQPNESNEKKELVTVRVATRHNGNSSYVPGWMWALIGVLGVAFIVLVLNAVGFIDFGKKRN
ncbi:MAG: hypothetical protein MJ132_06870 [Clostridia bacterium]|nr:hypothetical protein [Clostridia bacterium]